MISDAAYLTILFEFLFFYLTLENLIQVKHLFVDVAPKNLNLIAMNMHKISLLICSFLFLLTAHSATVAFAPQAKEKTTQTPTLKLPEAKPFSFNGYQGYTFTYNHVTCKIVQPNVTAKGIPWLIRARFWGHEPQLDCALLAHGFHIAYCDVADLYGSHEAVARWNALYQLLTKQGLNTKVALEGMSRGGLIIYNWAAQNLDKVACIYADAPVMDITTWPLGTKGGKRSDRDAALLTKAYGYTTEAPLYQWKHNPIDHAREIAKANLPLLHVVGDADKTVPVASNTAVFAKRLATYGYTLQIIHKPGIGHHPHSLKDPQPILDFILKATKQPSTF